MPTVAKTVVVHNRTSRAYFIGGIEVPAGGWGRVDGDHPFLAELISRGSFRIHEDAPAAPVVTAPEEQPAPKKTSTKTSSKGDDE